MRWLRRSVNQLPKIDVDSTPNSGQPRFCDCCDGSAFGTRCLLGGTEFGLNDLGPGRYGLRRNAPNSMHQSLSASMPTLNRKPRRPGCELPVRVFR